MRQSELLPFLQSLGASPKKGLSQNFLIDANVIQKIVALADVQPSDSILEIGPGPGSLTSCLLETGARVVAIEKDRAFAKALHRLQTEDQRLTCYEADALEFPISTLPFNKVVANLPYHITTPLLEILLQIPFESLTLMVQEEFAVRLFAKEGSKDFSSLSLFTQFFSLPKTSFFVSRNCFYPKPNVDSRVIHLEFRTPPNVPQQPFFKLVRTAFQQRRKMMSSSLKSLLPRELIQESLLDLSLRPDARPEMLSFDNWLLFLKKVLPCMVQENELFCPNRQTPHPS